MNFLFRSKAYGQHESKETILHGQLQLNVLQNLVCARRLDGKKENVHHSVITELQESRGYTRLTAAAGSLLLKGKAPSNPQSGN
jgi:DNA polymerase delta subunit 1